MILINSAAYVVPEFQAEVGKIPPCMLPVGNRKLLENQVDVLKKVFPTERIIVSLPESYILAINEQKLLNQLNIEVLMVPDKFELGEAILYALNAVENSSSIIRLIHGDTLVQDLPNSSTVDIIGVTESEAQYNWTSEHTDAKKTVWCGFFCFSSRQQLVRSLALSRGDFKQAVQHYNTHIQLNRVLIKEWYDLGHINTYFISRSAITTQRAFNALNICNGVLTKTGNPDLKIQAETNWFNTIPSSLKKYTPQLLDHGQLDSGKSFYSLEYLPMLPLNELFVHARNPANFWEKAFSLICYFLKSCTKDDLSTQQLDIIEKTTLSLYRDKTLKRLEAYSKENNIDCNKAMFYKNNLLPSLNEIAKHCIEMTLALPLSPGILHGDLCFSNILFDSRLESIKVIDPRGITESGNITIFGDQKYDLAKLTHSVIGLYDFIIAGRYTLIPSGEANAEINFDIDERIFNLQERFFDFKFNGLPEVKAIMPLTILLFLSMLPLHSDRPDRQEAMLVNALRLYFEYILED